MTLITDADREAAQSLRILLADISGFWFRIDDDSPLCAALARHRIGAEQRVAASLRAVEDHGFGPKVEHLARPGRAVQTRLPASPGGVIAAA